MSSKSAKIMMKCIGGTLAICSAVAMAGGCMSNSPSTCTKKTVKKTMHKITDFVDTVASFM